MLRATESRSRDTVLLIAGGLVLFAAFWLLGVYVTHHGEPAALWAFAQFVHGKAIGLAWILTNAGYAKVLIPLYALVLIFGLIVSRWRVPALFSLVTAIGAWRATDALQWYFARPRRADWLVHHETSFSYPSSHAAMSVAFYFLWGILLLRSALPRAWRYGAFGLLSALTLGIMWSRLALGAHYPSDIIGGVLLGGAIVLVAAGAAQVARLRLVPQIH